MVSWLRKMCFALMVLVVPFITDCSSNPTDPIKDIPSSLSFFWKKELASFEIVYPVDKMLIISSQGILTHTSGQNSPILQLITLEHGDLLWSRAYKEYVRDSQNFPAFYDDILYIPFEEIAINVKHKDIAWHFPSHDIWFGQPRNFKQFGRYMSWESLDFLDTVHWNLGWRVRMLDLRTGLIRMYNLPQTDSGATSNFAYAIQPEKNQLLWCILSKLDSISHKTYFIVQDISTQQELTRTIASENIMGITSSGFLNSSPLLYNNRLYFVTQDTIRCFESSGKLLWKYNIVNTPSSSSQTSSATTNFVGSTSQIKPIIVNNVLLVAQYTNVGVFGFGGLIQTDKGPGNLFAFDVNTGQILWHMKIPADNYTQLTLINNLVFVDGNYDGFPRVIIAIEPRTGKIVWRTPSTTNEEFIAVASNGGDTLYVQSTKALYAYKTPR